MKESILNLLGLNAKLGRLNIQCTQASTCGSPLGHFIANRFGCFRVGAQTLSTKRLELLYNKNWGHQTNSEKHLSVSALRSKGPSLFTVNVQAASTGLSLPEKAVWAGAAELQAVEEGTELVLTGSGLVREHTREKERKLHLSTKQWEKKLECGTLVYCFLLTAISISGEL